MILASHGIISSSGNGVPLLLDTYSGASVAYSLRKLNTSYTGFAIRVRRSNDDTSQDIGFVNGNLDTTSLLSFVGANNGFVSIWYDQSGNGIDMLQPTQSNQPQIVNSGLVILENSLPTVSFSTSQTLNTTSQNLVFYDCAISYVSRNISGAGAIGVFGYGTNAQGSRTRYLGSISNNLTFIFFGTDTQSSLAGMGDTNLSLYSLNFESNTANFYKNNSTQNIGIPTLFNTTTSSFSINDIFNRGERGNIRFSEAIFYTSGKSSNISSIRNNQNTFYSIY